MLEVENRVKTTPILRLETIHKEAAAIGFDCCGAVAVRRLDRAAERFNRWIEAGYQSSLGYLERHIEKRFNPALLVEGAQTVIVCAVSYKNAVSEGYPTDHRAKIASYACNQDYHTSIKKMLRNLFERLKEECSTLAGRLFVDSAPVAEKQWAVEAGIGWIGRQSLLITPQFGSFVHLGVLIINEACESYDTPFTESRCGTCRACIEHCPTGAILDEKRMINTHRCIACHTIEQQPASEIDLDGWIFGCDACQSCCPYNRHAPRHRHPAFDPLFDPRSMTPDEWQNLSQEEFTTRFASTPLMRSGLERIRGNIQKEGNRNLKFRIQNDFSECL